MMNDRYERSTDLLRDADVALYRAKEDGRSRYQVAHNPGMDVIAEGVETVEQLERLRQLECEYVPGLLLLASAGRRGSHGVPHGIDLASLKRVPR